MLYGMNSIELQSPQSGSLRCASCVSKRCPSLAPSGGDDGKVFGFLEADYLVVHTFEFVCSLELDDILG